MTVSGITVHPAEPASLDGELPGVAPGPEVSADGVVALTAEADGESPDFPQALVVPARRQNKANTANVRSLCFLKTSPLGGKHWLRGARSTNFARDRALLR